MREVNPGLEPPGYVLVFRELFPFIGRDTFNGTDEGRHHGNDRFGQALRILRLRSSYSFWAKP
jgi:hypothetical protein